jgi:hypothetical protein
VRESPWSLEVQFSRCTLNKDRSIMLVKRCFGIFVGCLVYGICVLATGQNAQLPKPLLLSKIATDGDLVTLPVTLNGKKSVLVVDTGNYSTTLDKTLKPQLTRAVPTTATDKAYAAGGDEFYVAPPITISGTESGQIEFPKEYPILLADVSKVREASKSDFIGVLGMDFLERYAVELDLHNGYLALRNSADVGPKPMDRVVEMSMDWRRPSVELLSPGLAYWGLIDTGGILSLYLEPEAYEHLLTTGSIARFSTCLGPAHPVAFAKSGRLRAVKMGPFVHFGLVISPHRRTLLGLHYWRRYFCTFDFPKRKMYLRPSPYFALNDEGDRCGICLERGPAPLHMIRVPNVLRGSIAERLGIQAGDWLISLDGKPVAGVPVQRVNLHLEMRTRELEIVLRRGGKDIELTLPPPKRSVPAATIVDR